MKYLVLSFLLLPLAHASPLDKMTCSEVVRAQVKEWKARGEWERRSFEGDDVYFSSPGEKVGEWILVKPIPDGTGLSKMTPEGRVEILLKRGKCRKKSTQYAQPKPMKDHVGDKDLQEFVDKNPKALIYVWSSSENKSRKGLDEIKKISDKIKVPLLVLMDKEVPKNEYAKYQEELGKDLTRRVDALEFQMRQIETFPTTLVVKDGKILVKMITGYKEATVLEKNIEDMLKGTGK